MSDINIMRELIEADVAHHIEAMGHSADLINEEIQKEWTEDRGSSVKRNCEHLEFMLAQDYISLSSTKKKPFTNAINAGKAYIAENE